MFKRVNLVHVYCSDMYIDLDIMTYNMLNLLRMIKIKTNYFRRIKN